MAGAPAWLLLLLFLCNPFFSSRHVVGRRRVEAEEGLCAELIGPLGYPCTEHMVETKDGYLLGVQSISGGWGGL